MTQLISQLIVLLSNKKKKKKKKTKDREEYGCTDGRTVRDEDLFFSVLNEDVDKKDSDTGLLQRKCAISKGERDRTYVGRHSILALRPTVTGLNKMANINGNIYLKPCDGFEKGLRTK